jgi:hypothetical protein
MYEIYQLNSTGADLIGQTTDLNQACAAAWSRARLQGVSTQVLDSAGGVQEIYLMANSRSAADCPEDAVYDPVDY